MTPLPQFTCHADARLFGGRDRVMPQSPVGPRGFRVIPASPTITCLAQLLAQLGTGHGFCISETALPDAMDVPETHFLTLTGGSSGQPKIILRSQASWIESFRQNAARFGIQPRDSIAVPGKLSHSLALYAALEGLYLGCDVHVIEALSPGAQVAQCIAAGIGILYATPTQLKRMIAAARGRTLPDLHLILCGGGHLDDATHKAVRVLAPRARIRVFYGAAETSFVTLGDDATPAGSVGKPYAGVRVKILDDAGNPTTGIGEVWVSSPYLFDRYAVGDSTDTRWRDGFLTVGELGRIDDGGFLWLKGRKGRMITIADQNVYPEMMESFIAGLPGAPSCAVLARPDAARGHHLIALLEGADDAALAHRVRTACRTAFGTLIAPRTVAFIPVLPRRPSGKVDLAALAAAFDMAS